MTEEKLLARLRRHRPDALEQLIDQYNGYVASIVTTVLGTSGTRQDVEELVSDVFLALWNHADALSPGKVKAYIGAAARNKAKSFLRTKRELPIDLDEIVLASPNTPEGDLLRQEQARLVREAIDDMEEPDREIFLRYYYYLETSADIATAMDMEPSTVRVHLMRGRNVLKRKFVKEDVL